MRFLRFLLPALLSAAPFLTAAEVPLHLDPATTLPVAQIQPGMEGEVWTVFSGSQVEPFKVRVTGVLRNGLGPGKDLIVCQLTDPRVQASGAVAGMSGSPLYIGGKLAGALSYQLQRFETVRYAGFTPISDMLEVGALSSDFTPQPLDRTAAATPRAGSGDYEITPLQPVFAVSGVSPSVAEQLRPEFAALGLNVVGIGGSDTPAPQTAPAGDTAGTDASDAPPATPFKPGDAVAVALSAGDITLAATGTVSMVDGDRLLAFGHPMMNLGNVELPMARAEILAILPSQLSSFKLSNTGAVVGTISQDRLSAISGQVGRVPPMIPVSIEVAGPAAPHTLNFSVVRHALITPQITALGLTQAWAGSNAGGSAKGWRITATMEFDGLPPLQRERLNAGAAGFGRSVSEFAQEVMVWLNNPMREVFPTRLAFRIEPLADNPQVFIEQFQLQRDELRPGDTLRVAIVTRGFQQEPERRTVEIPVPAAWAGRKLELVLAPGRLLDETTGATLSVAPGQVREFSELVAFVRAMRRTDGLFLAVLARGSVFSDQQSRTLDFPASLERIARTADELRYDRRDTLLPLWETHLLPGTVVPAGARRPFVVHAD